MTSTTHAPDISTLSTAIENRDAEGVLTWYADDAVLTILDRDHPPAAPLTFRGTAEIGDYYRDICGRNIEHRVADAVVSETGLAFTQHCRYPDGGEVTCVTVATLSDGKIHRQTAAQAWDG